MDEGHCPTLTNDPKGDFFFLRRLDPGTAVDTIVDLCRRRLPQNMGIPPDQIQVLSPTRKGTAGTAALNRALQAAVNPPAPGKVEKAFGPTLFREGDPGDAGEEQLRRPLGLRRREGGGHGDLQRGTSARSPPSIPPPAW